MFKTPWSQFSEKDETEKANGGDKAKPSSASKVSVNGGPRSKSRPSEDVKSEHHVKAHYDGSYTVTGSDGVDQHMPNHADVIEHMSHALQPESDDGKGPENASDKQSSRAGSGSAVSKHKGITGDIAR